MNILSRLPFLKSDSGDVVDEEAARIQAKADRIKFHRESVRNGPVTMKSISSGQFRRMQERGQVAKRRKTRNRQVRGYFKTQQVAASVRAHLQAAGILPYVHTDVDPVQQVHSTIWLVRRFGTEQEGKRVSFAYADVALALRTALDWYNRATDNVIAFPEGYELAVYTANDQQVFINEASVSA